MIVVDNLYKYYGERRAVGPLSFSIDKGEVVGLLGLNGAGKTTALRVLACDLLPSSGAVRVDGIDVVDQPHEVRRRIGYLPDSPPLYGEMAVREFLVFVARLRGMSTKEAIGHAAEAEKLTSLEGVAHDPIFSLSHGFKQRVGIAQALVHRPKLLLLDEPILGLDPVQIVEMRNLVRSLRGDFTIVLSSHNLKEISETCDRLLVIRDGTISASGTEAELSESLLRGFRITCTVRGTRSRVEDVVRSVDGVRSPIEVLGGGGQSSDGRQLVLQIGADRDARPDLVRALVAADIDVLALGQGHGELESVFLQLTGESDSPAVVSTAAPDAPTTPNGEESAPIDSNKTETDKEAS
jgi:ABC-2 type transport system ATP-binding protein